MIWCYLNNVNSPGFQRFAMLLNCFTLATNQWTLFTAVANGSLRDKNNFINLFRILPDGMCWGRGCGDIIMAMKLKCLCVGTWITYMTNVVTVAAAQATTVIPADTLDGAAQAERAHEYDGFELLMFMGLLILTIISIWVIKHFRLRFIHETGLSIVYGTAFQISYCSVTVMDTYNSYSIALLDHKIT